MIAALAPALIALASFLLRLIHLGSIKTLIFDEVYYVDGARDLLRYGVEVAGTKPEFVVHPPMGKWMIALGIKAFGDNSFGWRFSTALIGSLSIFLIGIIATRLLRSPIYGALASALMALDGLALVHSRTALLDNFLTFFIVLSTYFFIRKKYWATGIFLGFALATKWSALYFVVTFGCIALYRAFTHHTGRDLIKPTLERTGQFAVMPIFVYIASWSGWFAGNRGWDRDHSSNIFSSFYYYHQQILSFHTNLSDAHTYEANPWSWLIMGRPTSFFYETPKGCSAQSCSQEIIALGTPVLWWLGTIAIVVVFGLWVRSVITHRIEPALTIIVAGIAAGYLPWFAFQHRTVFTFYAIAFEPFLILALTYCARSLINAYGQWGKAIVGLALALILINFLYFLPIYMGSVITYDAWYARMWFPSWI